MTLPAVFRSPSGQNGHAHGQAFLILSAFFFAGMAVAARAASYDLPGPEVALVRFALGLACVFGVALARPSLLRVTRPRLLVLRGLLGGTTVLAYFTALEKLGAGLGTLLNNTYPLWAALFAAALLKEPLTRRIVLGLGLAVSGLVVVVGPDALVSVLHGASNGQLRLGLVCGVLAGIVGGAATTTIRTLRRTESSLAIFGAFCVGGLLVCIGPAAEMWRPIPGRVAGLLVVVALFSFCAQLLFTYALKFVPASGSVTNVLTVVLAYAFAELLLAEPIAARVLVGGAIVVAGIVLSQWRGAAALGPAAVVEAIE